MFPKTAIEVGHQLYFQLSADSEINSTKEAIFACSKMNTMIYKMDFAIVSHECKDTFIKAFLEHIEP